MRPVDPKRDLALFVCEYVNQRYPTSNGLPSIVVKYEIGYLYFWLITFANECDCCDTESGRASLFA
jgi:hypothetical protein